MRVPVTNIGHTPYGFEYDLDFPATYEEAWNKDDAKWREEDPAGWERAKREAANAKRRATREAKKKQAAEEAAAAAKAQPTKTPVRRGRAKAKA
jgi:hypothetical protein